jgi:penicillin-binding protein 2
MYLIGDRYSDSNKRVVQFSVFGFFVGFIFFFFALTLFDLQLTNGEANFEKSLNNAFQPIVIPAKRGSIYTSDGELLVYSEEVYRLSYNEIKDNTPLQERIGEDLGSVLDDMQSEDIFEMSDELYQKYIAEKLLAPEQLLKEYRRHYRFGDIFAPVTGYVSLPSQIDVESGVHRRSLVGRDGVERYYNDVLMGRDGSGIYLNRFDGSRDLVVVQSPIDGNDIYLNIKADWQDILYKNIQRTVNGNDALSGSAILVESVSGRVLAMVNYPSFDPNLFATGIDRAEYDRLINNPALPLLNKIIGARMSPGSTFKLVVSVIGMNLGLIDTNEVYYSSGCEMIDDNISFCEADLKVLGNVNFSNAIARSSNLYFCNLARKFSRIDDSSQSGAEYFLDSMNNFGIDGLTGIDLFGEIVGNLPSPEIIRSRELRNWGIGDMCNSFIGQGDVLITPIRMVSIVAALTNEGRMMKPYILDYVKDSDGKVQMVNVSNELGRLDIDSESLEPIESAMRQTVQSDLGSARLLGRFENDIRAKTGSADVSERLPNGEVRTGAHSWIVGTFDYKGIDYSFVVIQQFGGRGFQSVPVIADFIDCIDKEAGDPCRTD